MPSTTSYFIIDVAVTVLFSQKIRHIAIKFNNSILFSLLFIHISLHKLCASPEKPGHHKGRIASSQFLQAKQVFS